MKTLTLFLRDATQAQQYEGVLSFVGEDNSGSFGILPDHDRFMTALLMGLCRFKTTQGEWMYVATAGALLYFHDNRLYLTTRHYLIDNDYSRISIALTRQLLDEETRLRSQKQGLRKMEEEVLRQLWKLGRNEAHSRDEVR